LGIFYVETVIDAGLAAGTAGLLLAFGSVASIVARLLVGSLVDRGSMRPLPLMTAMILSGALAGAMFALSRSTPVLLVATVIGFAGGWGWNGLISYVAVRLHPGSPGEATGATQGAISLGGVLGPASFGLLADVLSLREAWLLLTASSVVGASLIGVVALRATRSSATSG
jgi:MFS family permease